jgi:PAS domain-containing protein
VLVDEAFEPLHFFGASRRYFSLPAGNADFSVLKLCLPELRGELKALCYRMRQEALAMLAGSGTVLRFGDEVLEVRPVLRRVQTSGDDPLRDADQLRGGAGRRVGAAAGATEALAPVEAADEIARLRQELADTREHLQAVIEQMEASNEEYQSLNEELQLASEELQAANEELQASNEELSSLNAELRRKSQEYGRLNATLGNIQNSIRTGLVVVEGDGRVSRFNALAGRVFGLLPDDIGQSLYRVPCHLDLPTCGNGSRPWWPTTTRGSSTCTSAACTTCCRSTPTTTRTAPATAPCSASPTSPTCAAPRPPAPAARRASARCGIPAATASR